MPTQTCIPPIIAAWSTAYAYIGIKHLGAGQFYLISIRDKDGQPFDGGQSYRLIVPPQCSRRTILVGHGL